MKLKRKIWNTYNKLLILLFGKFAGVSASKVCISEEQIFPEENFVMPKQKDVFGEEYKDYYSYKTKISPFYVRSFKNAYCFTDREEVFLSENKVILEYTSQKENPLAGTNRKILFNKKTKKINGSVVLLSLSGLENNYYHWLNECLGRYYLLKKSHYKPDYYILANNKPFQQQFISMLHINKSKIISTNESIFIQARELIVPDLINNWKDIYYRGYHGYQKQYLPSWIGKLYKNKRFRTSNKNHFEKIYISRKFANYRKLINEDEIVALLKTFGFKICTLETMSVMEQRDLFVNTSIILGVHGAGFGNMVFSPKSAIIFEIFPEYYHDAGIRIMAKVLGLRYYYLIGKTIKIRNINPQKEDVYIDLDKLKKALNLILTKNTN